MVINWSNIVIISFKSFQKEIGKVMKSVRVQGCNLHGCFQVDSSITNWSDYHKAVFWREYLGDVRES